jgi:hypothetical protein
VEWLISMFLSRFNKAGGRKKKKKKSTEALKERWFQLPNALLQHDAVALGIKKRKENVFIVASPDSASFLRSTHSLFSSDISLRLIAGSPRVPFSF